MDCSLHLFLSLSLSRSLALSPLSPTHTKAQAHNALALPSFLFAKQSTATTPVVAKMTLTVRMVKSILPFWQDVRVFPKKGRLVPENKEENG